MKKLITLLLAVIMSFSLVACGGGEEPLKSTVDLSDLLGGGSKTTAESTAATTEPLTNGTSATTTLNTTTAETPAETTAAPDYSDHSANSNSKDDETERLSKWEEILFNNVWYGTCHGVEGSGDTIELVFYEDGSYSARYGVGENAKTETWNFMRLYDTAGEYLENALIQTVPDYDTEKSLYKADYFTLGITNDGEYLLRTGTDYICYPIELVEITLDNWQEYFELELVVDEWRNADGELAAFEPEMRFHLKENWKSMAKEMDIVFEYTCTDGYLCGFAYNTETGELVEGEKVGEPSKPLLSETCEMNHIETEVTLFGGAELLIDWEGNIASTTAVMYSTVEILSIQGTIRVAK